jgi:hypothetical protein
MPAHTNPLGRFSVSFHRDGELLDDRTADTGERALRVAIALLTELDDLQNGNRLTVKEG